MADWTEHFVSSYYVMRVSRETGYETGVVDGVEAGGSLERNLDAALKDTGSLPMAGDLDVGADLVRVYLRATFDDGTVVDEALGTYLPSVSSRTLGGAATSQTVNLSGRLQELADDQFDGTYSLPAGSDPVGAAIEIATGAGLSVRADAHDSYVTSDVWVFDDSSDPSKLACVNQLLDLAGFSSADTDALGVVQMRRYRAPADRAPSWSLVEGPRSRFLREVTEERDATDVANVVKVVFSSDESVTVGIAEDHDGPYGIEALGRRVVKRYDYTQAATQEEADEKAARLLGEQRVVRKLKVSSIHCPLDVGDTTTMSYPSQGISGTFSVRKITTSLGAGCMETLEVRDFA